MKNTRSLRARRRSQRGQAMVEYSVITWLLVLMLVLGGTARIPMFGTQTNLIEAFMDAYQVYYDSFYYVLNMPFP